MAKNVKFERGDSVKFGEKWCDEHNCKQLSGKTVMMTPQWFDDDNGLYAYYSECPGMIVDDEPESIYHLFGNNFESFMDCEHIKGSEEDKAAYANIIKELQEAEARAWEKFVASYAHTSRIELKI